MRVMLFAGNAAAPQEPAPRPSFHGISILGARPASEFVSIHAGMHKDLGFAENTHDRQNDALARKGLIIMFIFFENELSKVRKSF